VIFTHIDAMTTPAPANIPKDWKPFRLANGTTRWLPDWADKPLGFAFDPQAALRRAAYVKLPKRKGRAVRLGGKSC